MRLLSSVTLVLALATPAAATDYSAELLGREVVPPTPSPGRGTFNMFGVCDADSPDSSSFAFHLAYEALSQEAMGAHIHLGAPGTNGPAVYELADAPFWLVAGLLKIAPVHCEALAEGLLYVVIETPECPWMCPLPGYPEGEIRGQILREFGPEGEDCSSAVEIDITGTTQLFNVSTLGRENDIDTVAMDCTGIVATGPDVVFVVHGNEHGTVIELSWSGDFEAAVYAIVEDCSQPCLFGATGETLAAGYESGDYQGDPGGSWIAYIVIDGVDGASGSGTLEIFTDLAIPTQRVTWGRIKSVYH